VKSIFKIKNEFSKTENEFSKLKKNFQIVLKQLFIKNEHILISIRDTRKHVSEIDYLCALHEQLPFTKRNSK
jgi:hypothetical protein